MYSQNMIQHCFNRRATLPLLLFPNICSLDSFVPTCFPIHLQTVQYIRTTTTTLISYFVVGITGHSPCLNVVGNEAITIFL